MFEFSQEATNAANVMNIQYGFESTWEEAIALLNHAETVSHFKLSLVDVYAAKHPAIGEMKVVASSAGNQALTFSNNKSFGELANALKL